MWSQKNTKLQIRDKLVELGKQSITTKTKKAEQLTANLVVYNGAIIMMENEIFLISV